MLTIIEAIRLRRVRANRGVFQILVLDGSDLFVALHETRNVFACGVWGTR